MPSAAQPDRKQDVLIEFNVPCRMRDGVILRADVYRPARIDEPLPVLLTRYPYGKNAHLPERAYSDPVRLAQAGYSVVIQDVRGRFASDGAPTLVQPGQPYEYTIDLWATARTFFAGHRIRVEITSSSFPRWDRNLNTGHDPFTDTEMRVAQQQVVHSPAMPSHIVLPSYHGRV